MRALGGRAFEIVMVGSLVIVAGCIGGVSPGSTDLARSAPPIRTALSSASSKATVPVDIRDRAWAFTGLDRTIAGGPDVQHLRVIAPSDELLIVVLGDDALTTTNTNGRGPNTVRLRNLSTGDVRWEAQTPMTCFSAAIVGDRVLLANTSQGFVDSGVRAVDPKNGRFTEIFPPQDLPDDGSGFASRWVFVSPTGQTVVTQVCAQNGVCETQILDPKTGSPTSVGQLPIRIRYVTDEVAIGTPELPTRLVAFALRTGERVWRVGDVEMQTGYLTTDGRLVQSYIDHADAFRYKVAIIDPATGSLTVTFDAEVTVDRQLWRRSRQTGMPLSVPGSSPRQ